MKFFFAIAFLFLGSLASADQTTYADTVVTNVTAIPTPSRIPSQCYGSFADWGRGRDGWGYCYEFNCYGQVLRGGRPIPNNYCENTYPSYFNWGRGRDGFTYCYQFTPYGVPMNQGRAVPNYYCR